jgi:hypothetical protein
VAATVCGLSVGLVVHGGTRADADGKQHQRDKEEAHCGILPQSVTIQHISTYDN